MVGRQAQSLTRLSNYFFLDKHSSLLRQSKMAMKKGFIILAPDQLNVLQMLKSVD
jgi:hypothetical protein